MKKDSLIGRACNISILQKKGHDPQKKSEEYALEQEERERAYISNERETKRERRETHDR